MKVAQTYSYKRGEEILNKHHSREFKEVIAAIENTNAANCMLKVSEEKTMKGKLLFSPVEFNNQIKAYLLKYGWTKKTDSKKGFKEPRIYFGKNRFREMDGIKNKVGLEVQFGKYAFMGYDIFSKMVIFKNKDKIECGIEVVPTQELVRKMSTGVSGFDQILVDFENRGEANIDVPVLVLGIGLTYKEMTQCQEMEKLFQQNPSAFYKKFHSKKPGSKTKPGPK